MAGSPIEAATKVESTCTPPVKEKLDFDDDTLKGEKNAAKTHQNTLG